MVNCKITTSKVTRGQNGQPKVGEQRGGLHAVSLTAEGAMYAEFKGAHKEVFRKGNLRGGEEEEGRAGRVSADATHQKQKARTN